MHLVSPLACNTSVIVHARSNPPVAHVKLPQKNPRVKSLSERAEINIALSINQVLVQETGKSYRVVVW